MDSARQASGALDPYIGCIAEAFVCGNKRDMDSFRRYVARWISVDGQPFVSAEISGFDDARDLLVAYGCALFDR